MSDYLSFQKYITGYFVKAIYFIGFLAFTAAGIGLTIWSAMRLQAGSLPTRLGWYYIAGGVAILLVGNLVWRVSCELWVVLFNIYDRLVSVDRKLAGEAVAADVTHDDVTREVKREKTRTRGTDVMPRPAGVLGLT